MSHCYICGEVMDPDKGYMEIHAYIGEQGIDAFIHHPADKWACLIEWDKRPENLDKGDGPRSHARKQGWYDYLTT
jgi:hypothetical protein